MSDVTLRTAIRQSGLSMYRLAKETQIHYITIWRFMHARTLHLIPANEYRIQHVLQAAQTTTKEASK